MLDSLKFQPNTLTVAAGQNVTLNLRNGGVLEHDFYSPALNLTGDNPVPGGKTAQVSFTAPSQLGTYDFWCHVPGHGEAGMVGRVIVK